MLQLAELVLQDDRLQEQARLQAAAQRRSPAATTEYLPGQGSAGLAPTTELEAGLERTIKYFRDAR